MSQRITHEVLDELLDQGVAPAVTIYMPTHRSASPPHISEDRTRYKNLIRKAEEIMSQHDDRSPDVIRSVMDRLNAFIDDIEFWERRMECTVFCVNPESVTVLDAPIDTEEYVAVDTHFHLAPLFALARENVPFYVLTVSLQNPQLFKGDMYELEPAGVALPTDMKSALSIDEMAQRQHHYHGRAGGYATGQRAGSNARDAGDEERRMYYRMIDEKVCSVADTSWPLVLVGLETEVAEYRHISKYPRLMERSIDSNYAQATSAEIHQAVWPVVREEIIDQMQKEAVERFEELRGLERAVVSRAAIKDAAEKGRIDTLFVRLLAKTRDTVRDGMKEVMRITFMDAPQNQFVDQIALQAWHQGATVINLDDTKVPEMPFVAAALRY